MKIILDPRRDAGPNAGTGPVSRGSEGGFAVLVVLILLLIMMSLAVGNNIALGQLQSELRLVERRQLQRRAAIQTTNTAAASPLERAAAPAGVVAPVKKP